jgi:hypothetical protein
VRQGAGRQPKRGIYDGLLAAFDLSADDQRFVMMRTVDDSLAAPQLVIVENWFEELKEKTER